jgi:SAM-dependent methyltransferase
MTTTAEDIARQGRSFDAWASEYDRYRPGYPDVLFERIQTELELPSTPVAADLGAGTGRASLAMAARGWLVTAVEPGSPMLEVLTTRATEAGLHVATVAANAEDTGIASGSVDLATAAQAFHWFDRDRALAEMARIVRPGGGIALFWNMRDERRSAFVVAYHDLLEASFGSRDTGRYLEAGRPTGRHATRAALERASAFESVKLAELNHEVVMTAAEFIGMAFTASYVRAQAPEGQAAFHRAVETLLERHGLVDKPFSIPYSIDLWTAQRTDR